MKRHGILTHLVLILAFARFTHPAFGDPPTIVAIEGTPQSARIGTVFPVRFKVLVRDSAGNLMPGVTVTWTPPSSGPSGTFVGGINTAVTDSNGVAVSARFVGNIIAGWYVVIATAPGIPEPALFYLRNLPGPPAFVTALAGTPQSTIINTYFPVRFKVLVRDAAGNAVPSITVLWQAPAGGPSGTFDIVMATFTDSNGIAIAPPFLANGIAGSYLVTANVAGVASPAIFQLVNLPATGAWVTQVTGIPDVTPYAVSVVDQNVCWLAGATGKIIRTTNGGNSWALVNSGIIGAQNIYAFEAVDESIAFASTSRLDLYTFIYRTSDAGSSWTIVHSQPVGFMIGLKMFDTRKGIAVGDPIGPHWTILKTTDGGQSWLHTLSEPPVIGAGFSASGFGTFDTNYVWFFDNLGHLYLSSDCGETWNYSNFPAGSKLFRMNSLAIRMAVGSQNEIYRTTNGGTTWETFAPFIPHVPATGLAGRTQSNEFWFVLGGIHYTSDACSTWSLNPPNGLNASASLIDMVTDGPVVSAWATGQGDTLYHYTRTATDVQPGQLELPRSFLLHQNYPNPFNPTTTISYQLSAVGRVTLKVFDLLGREVATLVDEEMGPGSYERVFNAGEFASGVYFYSLRSGGYVQTKKLALIR